MLGWCITKSTEIASETTGVEGAQLERTIFSSGEITGMVQEGCIGNW